MFRRILAALCALLLLPLSGCGSDGRRSAEYYTFFDTVTTVIGYGSEQDFAAACSLIEETLSEYHRLCDIYHEYNGINNARTINLRAGQQSVEVSDELLDVIEFGREVYAMTEGRCNIAMGAVLSLWHDCRETALSGGPALLPEEAALQEAGNHCRMDQLIVDRAAGTVYLADSAMSLDLGAIAKGYAVEKAARALAGAGFTGYALNVGGNVRTVGRKAGGSAWISGIQDPDNSASYLLRLELTDASLVTSGSYQRWYQVGGTRYHHIIDPRTLYPKNDFLSVSILCSDSGLADALSTAVFNMELEEGINYVNRLEGVEACWVLADKRPVYSGGFEANIKK